MADCQKWVLKVVKNEVIKIFQVMLCKQQRSFRYRVHFSNFGHFLRAEILVKSLAPSWQSESVEFKSCISEQGEYMYGQRYYWIHTDTYHQLQWTSLRSTMHDMLVVPVVTALLPKQWYVDLHHGPNLPSWSCSAQDSAFCQEQLWQT